MQRIIAGLGVVCYSVIRKEALTWAVEVGAEGQTLDADADAETGVGGDSAEREISAEGAGGCAGSGRLEWTGGLSSWNRKTSCCSCLTHAQREDSVAPRWC